MGSSETFENELTQLLPRLRRFAFSLSRNGADADDLAQATIERALRSREQWQPGTRLDSWLYRIMRNLWIDMVRARGRLEKREAPVEDAAELGHDPRPEIEASLRSISLSSAESGNLISRSTAKTTTATGTASCAGATRSAPAG
jgi:RNA polymerase sigma-70 factor (ECF subfamily)